MNKSAANSVHQRRIAIAAITCVVAFAVVGLRLVDVGLIRGGSGTAGGDEAVLLERADLVDRNGELLARDLPVHDLYARPHAFQNKVRAAADLAAATHSSVARLTRILNSSHPYVLIARRLSPDAENRVMELGLPGLDFTPATKRFYPKGLAARQVIGFTDTDGNGVSGAELGLDEQLKHGEDGPVQLSLDMRIQHALAHETELARENFSARAAGGIVMNVNTGEILAMASLPDSGSGPFPPDLDPRRNRMVQDRYELGSVFKIFAFALAMEDHTTKLDELFPVGGGFKLGKYTIRDAEKLPALMTARDILAQSSNAGTAQIALRSGPGRQRAWLETLGLMNAAPVELKESASPRYPRNWGQVETATIGFGHGISVSPLAFATAAAEVVNGGRRIAPTLLRQSGDRRGEQILAPETSATMRELLRYVVTNGTGKKADIPGYDVGGKTGSAEKVGKHGGYVEHKLLTSFCAVFPISNPRYLVFVMLDEPHGTKETFGLALAGFTAAPLAGRVIARIAPMLGMPTSAPILAATKENT